MSAPTPPWEAEAIEAFAAGSTRDFDQYQREVALLTPPKVRSRALGVTSLVLALFPIAFVFVCYLIGLVIIAGPSTGFEGLGPIFIGLIGGAVSAAIGFPIAIVTGIMAVRRGRGSGLGIAGIAVAGGVLVLFGGNILTGVITSLALR